MLQSEQNKSYIFHGAGGAADGAYPIEYLRFLANHTRLEPHQLFDFFVGDSVSSLFAAALNTPHPDNPQQSRYTTEALAEMFYGKIAEFIPYKGWRSYHKHIMGGQYIDRSPMEEGLQHIFGSATLGDTLKSTLITSQRIDGGRRPHIFTSLKSDIFQKTIDLPSLVDSEHVPLYQAALAAMAHDIFLGSYTVEHTGTTHSDFAAVANRAPEIQVIQAGLNPRAGLPSYVYFGTGENNVKLTPSLIQKLDNTGIVSLKKPRALQQGGVVEAKYAERSSIGIALGEENVHVFEMDANDSSFQTSIPTNAVDTRPETMKLRQEAAQEYIELNIERFTRLADDMGENFVRKQQSEPVAAFVDAALPAQENGWLGRLTAKFPNIRGRDSNNRPGGLTVEHQVS